MNFDVTEEGVEELTDFQSWLDTCVCPDLSGRCVSRPQKAEVTPITKRIGLTPGQELVGADQGQTRFAQMAGPAPLLCSSIVCAEQGWNSVVQQFWSSWALPALEIGWWTGVVTPGGC